MTSIRKMFGYDREVEEAVAKFVGTTIEALDADVELLRKWCETQPHFPEVLDRKPLRSLLVIHKLSIESTKKAIDCYYTFRTRFPEVFENTNPKLPHMKATFGYYYGAICKEMTEDKNRIGFLKMKDPVMCEKINPYHALAMFMNVAELRLWKDLRCQEIFILDVKGVNLSHLSVLSPSFIATVKCINKYIFNKERVKAAYIVNTPQFIISFLKTILKPKVFERINIYPNADILKEVVPKHLLPKDYGGEGESLQELQDLLAKEMETFQERYDKLDELRVDESLRPEKLENNDILGFHGTFKKLNVD